MKLPVDVAEPDHRAGGVAARSRRSGREKQIERSVVIEISDVQAHLARKVGAGVRHSCDLGGLPALSFVLVRNPEDSAVGLHRQQIENAVVVGVRHGHGFDGRQTRGQRALLELSLTKIHEDVQPARAIDDRGIGIAVAIQIGPGKPAYAGNSVEGMNGQEGSISIISQDGRSAGFCAQHDIEIAVGFNVHRPRSGVAGIGDRFG